MMVNIIVLIWAKITPIQIAITSVSTVGTQENASRCVGSPVIHDNVTNAHMTEKTTHALNMRSEIENRKQAIQKTKKARMAKVGDHTISCGSRQLLLLLHQPAFWTYVSAILYTNSRKLTTTMAIFVRKKYVFMSLCIIKNVYYFSLCFLARFSRHVMTANMMRLMMTKSAPIQMEMDSLVRMRTSKNLPDVWCALIIRITPSVHHSREHIPHHRNVAIETKKVNIADIKIARDTYDKGSI